MKSKSTARVLALIGFFGIAGLQYFYVDKPLKGILFLITFGLCGVGTFLSLASIGQDVDLYNVLHGFGPNGGGKAEANANANASNNTVINLQMPAAPPAYPSGYPGQYLGQPQAPGQYPGQSPQTPPPASSPDSNNNV